jgi:hypothetical protein
VLLHGRTLSSALDGSPSKIAAAEAKIRGAGRSAFFRSLAPRSGHFPFRAGECA